MQNQTDLPYFNSSKPRPFIGSLGHFVIFLWALIMVLLKPLMYSILPMLFLMGIIIVMYPFALRRLMRPRWVAILMSIFLVNVFFSVSEDTYGWVILGLPVSSKAVFNGMQMTLHAMLILMAADGFSSSVNIVEVAGLFEHSGLRGLGFSIGVATNLLPDLRQSSLNAWHNLRMRGGFRAQWWRGIQLMMLTIISNALRHADEIVLAADVRAFRPELSMKISICSGTLDGWIIVAVGIFLAVVLII